MVFSAVSAFGFMTIFLHVVKSPLAIPSICWTSLAALTAVSVFMTFKVLKGCRDILALLEMIFFNIKIGTI